MSTTFASIDEISEYLESAPNPWAAVGTLGGDLYLVFAGEDTDAYQGIPYESDDGLTDANVGALDQFPGALLPVVLLTASDAEEWQRRALDAEAKIAAAMEAYKAGPSAFHEAFKTALAMYEALGGQVERTRLGVNTAALRLMKDHERNGGEF